jgi:hypothetical protein
MCANCAHRRSGSLALRLKCMLVRLGLSIAKLCTKFHLKKQNALNNIVCIFDDSHTTDWQIYISGDAKKTANDVQRRWMHDESLVSMVLLRLPPRVDSLLQEPNKLNNIQPISHQHQVNAIMIKMTRRRIRMPMIIS